VSPLPRMPKGGGMSTLSTGPVVVDMSATTDAVRWAADYARLRGLPLRLVHNSSDILSVVDPIGSVHPGVEVHHEFTTGPVVDVLVAESETAHLVVVGHRPRSAFAELVSAPTAFAVSTRARCPVVAVPAGVRSFDQGHPVVVGVHDGGDVADLLDLSFAEAAALDTGVIVVRCAPRSDDIASDVIRDAISAAANRHPGVRVRTELIDRSAGKGLAWHAHFGSAVVVGSHGGLRSVGRTLLRRSTIPVLLVGSHALVPHRPVPTLDGN
jgi:nucleotide-binding universal stress UspA family protein